MVVRTRAADRLGRALAWAIDEGKQVPGTLSTEDLVHLKQELAVGRPFPSALYPKLRLFAQIVWRIELPDPANDCTLADALDAITELASSTPSSARASVTPWSFTPHVEAATFEELSYAAGAEGIDREYRNNREGWAVHGEHSKRFVCDALQDLVPGKVAWVFGAGRAYDLPLPELAEHFERVVLVDIDREALEATRGTLDASLRARFELVAADLTGVAAAWRARTLAAVRDASDAREAARRLDELYRGYVVADESPWSFLGEGADLIVSQMLLSQLNEPLERFPQRLYEERFGVPLFAARPDLRVENMLFAHRVQHDHLRFLMRHAPAAVLTSDVAEQYTQRGLSGAVEPVGDELLLLGAYRLAERIPRGLEILRQKQWQWQRAIPRLAGQVGSRMRVGALLLRGA